MTKASTLQLMIYVDHFDLYRKILNLQSGGLKVVFVSRGHLLTDTTWRALALCDVWRPRIGHSGRPTWHRVHTGSSWVSGRSLVCAFFELLLDVFNFFIYN